MLIDASAKIGAGCIIGPNVVIGPGVVVGDGVRLLECTLLAGAKVESYARVAESIVGWSSIVRSWCRVEGGAVLGEDVTVSGEAVLIGTVVCPHKGIRQNMLTPGTIVM